MREIKEDLWLLLCRREGPREHGWDFEPASSCPWLLIILSPVGERVCGPSSDDLRVCFVRKKGPEKWLSFMSPLQVITSCGSAPPWGLSQASCSAPDLSLGAPGGARGKQLVSDTSSYVITLLPAISDWDAKPHLARSSLKF